jgi:hypothetical protein
MWPCSTAGCGSRRVTEFAARRDAAFGSASVVLLWNPRMLLVSMANSDRISKRPLLPAATGVPAARGALAGQRSALDVARGPWRDCTRLAIDGGQAACRNCSAKVGSGRCDTNDAVTHPLGASRRQPWRRGSARRTTGAVRLPRLPRRSLWHVLGRAPHLVNPVRQVGSIVGRQHHRIFGHRRHAVAIQRSPLLVRPLPARLPAVLAAPAHPGIGDVSAAPSAGLRVGAAAHACRL